MTQISVDVWKAKRTEETEMVERVLRGGFETVDAYRYNPASIRVRVVDPRFEGMPAEQRDAMVDEYLSKLPDETQADIMNLFLFAPSELGDRLSHRNLRQFARNSEFEEPSPSML